MAISSGVALFVALRFVLLLLGSAAAPVLAAPAAQNISIESTASSSWWMNSITRQGASAFNPDASYQVFRNVMDFGAKGKITWQGLGIALT